MRASSAVQRAAAIATPSPPCRCACSRAATPFCGTTAWCWPTGCIGERQTPPAACLCCVPVVTPRTGVDCVCCRWSMRARDAAAQARSPPHTLPALQSPSPQVAALLAAPAAPAVAAGRRLKVGPVRHTLWGAGSRGRECSGSPAGRPLSGHSRRCRRWRSLAAADPAADVAGTAGIAATAGTAAVSAAAAGVDWVPRRPPPPLRSRRLGRPAAAAAAAVALAAAAAAQHRAAATSPQPKQVCAAG